MVPDRPALARCIGIPPAEFAAEYWGTRPLLTPAPPGAAGFADLLTLDAVDELLSRRGLRTPFLRLAKDGTVIDPAAYTRSGGAGAEVADQVADDLVLGLVVDGATVVLQALHRVWPPIMAFSTDLASDLGHPVQVNAYVTPPSSRGFAAHYDVHDVFVLQVAGEKRWTVWPPVHPYPLRTSPWTDHAAAVGEAAAQTPPALETVLRPGDALYLPRGYLHGAQALGATSAHLTVGVHPVTRYALVEALLAQAGDDPQLRESLPLGDVADPEMLQAELALVCDRLVAALGRADVQAVAGRLRAAVDAGVRAAPLAPIAQAAAVAAAGADTAIRARAGLRARLRAGEPGRVRLVLPDRVLALPEATRPALLSLLTGRSHLAGALPGLDAADGVVLVRRLLREGILVPA